MGGAAQDEHDMSGSLRFAISLFAALAALGASSAERRPGAIRMSDGVELRGEIWFNTPELKIYEGEDAAGGKFTRVKQDELASITFSVKQAAMERPWRFKNAGSDEKEYLDGEYPVVELKSETKLTSGQVMKGHVYTVPVFVRVQDRENPMDYDTKKFILRYQHKGETGQQIKDVAYVTSITFDGADAAAADRGVISGSLKDLGKVEMASAFGIHRVRAYEGKVDPAKSTFRIAELPVDTYELAVMTDKGIYVGLADITKTPKEEIRALDENDPKLIAAEVAKFRDFFDHQHVLMVKGDKESAKTIVHQRREEDIHGQQDLKGKEIHRLDIWCWHQRQTEWHIDQSLRANLFRYHEAKGARARSITHLPKMSGLAIGAGEAKTVDVNAEDLKAGQELKPVK
jgi:hypothetical protein